MQIAEQSVVVKIILVKSQSIFREAIARQMSECEDIQVVADIGTIADTRLALAHTRADIVISDIELPDGSVYSWIVDIKTYHPNVKVILLSAKEDTDAFIRAVSLGVHAFMVTSSSYEDLLRCVRSVMKGEYIYSELVCVKAIRKLVADSSNDEQGCSSCNTGAPQLSARENQVLDLISRGLSNKEIAMELTISLSTAKTHVSRIFKRMGVSSRRELIPRLYCLVEPNEKLTGE